MDVHVNRQFISCEMNQGIPNKLWAKGDPDNRAKVENCIHIGFNPPFLGHVDIFCEFTNRAICQVNFDIIQ